jgi:hypothetical protein
VTQLIKVNGTNITYTVKYESLVGQIKSLPGAALEFAVVGKHLFLRYAGNEYTTNILAVTALPLPGGRVEIDAVAYKE